MGCPCAYRPVWSHGSSSAAWEGVRSSSCGASLGMKLSSLLAPVRPNTPRLSRISETLWQLTGVGPPEKATSCVAFCVLRVHVCAGFLHCEYIYWVEFHSQTVGWAAIRSELVLRQPGIKHRHRRANEASLFLLLLLMQKIQPIGGLQFHFGQYCQVHSGLPAGAQPHHLPLLVVPPGQLGDVHRAAGVRLSLWRQAPRPRAAQGNCRCCFQGGCCWCRRAEKCQRQTSWVCDILVKV